MEYLFLTVSALTSLIVNGIGLFRRKPVAKILVFKLDHLGDVVTATPALDFLRSSYPAAEITMVAGSWVARILEGHPSIDKLIEYDSPRFDRGERGSGKLKLRAVLPDCRYDLIVGLRDDWASLRASLTGGAAGRTDRGTIRLIWNLHRLLSGRWSDSRHRTMHEVETNLRIAGADPRKISAIPSLPVREAEKAWVRRELVSERLNRGEFVVLHPGAHSPLRRWPAGRFAALARWIHDTGRFEVVVTGNAEEAGLVDSIVEMAGSGVFSLAGETSLPRVVAVISEARAMVSLDTGVMHIATAVGTPVVALVGPEDPARFGPYGPGHAVLYHSLPCSPCDQVHCVRATPECMESISVDQVIEAVSRILSVPSCDGMNVDRGPAA